MRRMLFPLVGAIVASLGTAEVASAQVAKDWTYTSPAGVRGDFRDEGGGNWVELQNGQRAFTFREVSRGYATVDLYDGSRGIRVLLSPGTCLVKRDGATILTYNGGWFWREYKVTGKDIRFVNTTGTTWVEYQNGQTAFTFQAIGRYNDSRVILFDNSRGIRVELTLSGGAKVMEDGRLLFTYPGTYVR